MTDIYRRDLALVHDLGFGFHGDRCAPGILAALEPVRGEPVLELGCGSGALTRHLLAAGHPVIATDASPAMVERARAALPGADVRRLTVPHDPLPRVGAVVAVGNVLNYLDSEATVHRALAGIAAALTPGGVLAVDLLDRAWPADRRNLVPLARVTDDWAVFGRSTVDSGTLLVEELTTFVPAGDGGWRRADERLRTLLLDPARCAAVLAEHGVAAAVRASFGSERLGAGRLALVGMKA
jgi:SAM-dependent methyltransferase